MRISIDIPDKETDKAKWSEIQARVNLDLLALDRAATYSNDYNYSLENPVHLKLLKDKLLSKDFNINIYIASGGYTSVDITPTIRSDHARLIGEAAWPTTINCTSWFGEAYTLAVAALAAWELTYLCVYPQTQLGWEYRATKVDLKYSEFLDKVPAEYRDKIIYPREVTV